MKHSHHPSLFSFFHFFILSFFILSGCSEDAYQSRLRELIIDDITFGPNGGSQALTFRNEDLSAYECQSSHPWCTAELDVPNSRLKVSVAPNDTYDPRTATITIADLHDSTMRTLTVTQSRNTGLFLGATQFEVSQYGGSATVDVESNVDYEVQIPDTCSWVTLSQPSATRGLEKSSFTLLVSENKSYRERKAQIKVTNKSEGLSGTVTVVQPFEAVFKADTTSFRLDMDGGIVTINMESNIDYEVVIPDEFPWIKILQSSDTRPTRAPNQSVVTLRVLDNMSYSPRDGIACIRNRDAGCEIRVSIHQTFAPVLTAGTTSFEVGMEGAVITVPMESNIPYEVIIPENCNWVTRTPSSRTRAVSPSSVSLTVAENKSYRDREVIVTIVNSQAGISVPISIHQPFVTVFKADKTTFDVDMQGGTVTVNIESNISYDVTLPDDCDWIEIPPRSRPVGKSRSSATSAVTLRVRENTSYRDRDAVITIGNRDAGAEIKVTVHQPFTTIFKADKTAFEVDMQGGTVTVNMESNISYDVSIPSDCDWISLPTNSRKTGKTRATSTSSVVLRVRENTSYKEREAVVIISNKQANAEIKIYIHQPFTTTFKVDKTEFEVGTEGGSVSVSVESNVPFDIKIPSECDWISQVSSSRAKASKTSVITFLVSKNTVQKDRSASITIYNNTAGVSASLKITQKFNTLFSVDETPVEIDELGGTVGIHVAANVNITVQPMVTWLTLGEKTSQGNGYWTQQIRVSPLKTKVAQRKGKVKFLYEPTNQSFNVEILQNRLLYITESEVTLTEKGGSTGVTLNNTEAMEVKWLSSNTEVATVSSSGKITAVENGNAVITVISSDGKYSDTVNVTVSIEEKK